MKVGVAGLWHLGSVTAACLASAGHRVFGVDKDAAVVAALSKGQPPLFEPGLPELIRAGIVGNQLSFSTDPQTLKDADVCWVTFDTPVDENDQADVQFVIDQSARIFSGLKKDALVLVSSQIPVGSTRRLEQLYAEQLPSGSAHFAYSPENLRLGKAIEAFRQPDRVVVGLRQTEDKNRVEELLKPFTTNIEWMSVESAEMTKHALNAFLATSVAFINEIAVLCEQTGADAQEVERGLKSERRIGKLAYLKPGPAFSGGTLARDVCFLEQLGRSSSCSTPLLSGIISSNAGHKEWLHRRLLSVLKNLAGKTIAVLGLTYKPNTDTLRRSGAVETCRWLLSQNARVNAFDPAVKETEELSAVHVCNSATEALNRADAVLVATPWPDFLKLSADDFVSNMTHPKVFDPARFLEQNLRGDKRINYFAIGGPA